MDIDTKPVDLKVEPSTSKEDPSSKLGLCEVCVFHQAKFTCSKCEMKTCSLKCNKIHKLEVECDGQRGPSSIIPLGKFKNLNISSDYKLLDEITRSLKVSRNKFGRKWSDISEPLVKLRNAAKVRRVTLKFFPKVFERRKINSSYFNFKANIIYWHIDWIFVNADNMKFVDTKIPETSTISSILSKYLSKDSDEKLHFYKGVDFTELKVLLKAEQKGGKKFYELDPSLTLRECLEKKIIIEYPCIHVVLRDQSFGYTIIDSDDEDSLEDDGYSKSENEDESIYGALKNLLFVSDYCDEDTSSENQ